MKTVIFSHGKESGPYGSKIVYLMEIAKKLGFDAISIDYRDIPSPDDRVTTLIETAAQYKDIVLVGSSMGGYVSLVGSEQINPLGLFLLAPAVYINGYKKQSYSPKFKEAHIVFGYNDEVIPVDNGIKLALEHKIPITLISSDHRLNADLNYIGEIFSLFLKKL